MTSIEPKLNRDDVYEAVASAYLDRLAGHHFMSWPAGAEAAVENILSIPSPSGTASVPAVEATPNPTTGLWAMPLSDALAYWKEKRRPRSSSISAATKSVVTFIDMFGDVIAGRISRPMMIGSQKQPVRCDGARTRAVGQHRCWVASRRDRRPQGVLLASSRYCWHRLKAVEDIQI